MPEPVRYQSTGALLPGSPLYVRRAADDELMTGLLAGDFCYVLSARQMGKSSLLSQTVGALKENGVRVATANLQAAGDVKEESEWYEGLIDQLVNTAGANPGFTMPFEWGAWWDLQRGPFAQRFVNFIREALLASGDTPWVIAVDEIDATIPLPFTDSFFAAIRLCYDYRPGQPEFRRLSFVLLGVAKPSELMKDRARTPFNIGRPVELTTFTPEEALPLMAGLGGEPAQRRAVLERVLHWTGGQPHLTQLTCEALAAEWKKNGSADVDALVTRLFFRNDIFKEPHFAYIAEKRIGRFERKARLLQVLVKCREEAGCDGSKFPAEAAELKISGLVKAGPDGRLRVANRIYERIFNDAWIRKEMPPNRAKYVAIFSTALAAALLLLWVLVLQPMNERRQDQTFVDGFVRSIDGADKDIPRKAYEVVKHWPGQAALAEERWAAYWARQTTRLRELTPAILSGSDGPKEEFDAICQRLVEALKESKAIQDGVHRTAAFSAAALVDVLQRPIEINESAAQTARPQGSNPAAPAFAPSLPKGNLPNIEPLAGRTRRQAAEIKRTVDSWKNVSAAMASLAPLLEAPVREQQFKNVIGLIGDAQLAERDQAVDKYLSASASKADTPDADQINTAVRTMRLTTLNIAGLGLARAAPSAINPALAETTLATMERLTGAQAQELANLSRVLAIPAGGLESRDAAPLAGRMLVLLEKETREAERESRLAGTFIILAGRVDAIAAELLAGKVLRAMEGPPGENPDRLLGLSQALAALGAQIELRAASPLAIRGMALVLQVLERDADLFRPSETGASPRLVTAGQTLAPLLACIEPKDASPLAARGAAVLLRAIEVEPKNSWRLSAIFEGLSSVAARLDRADAAQFAGRLVQMMGTITGENADAHLASLANMLAEIAGRADAPIPPLFATQAATLLLAALDRPLPDNSDSLPELGSALAKLTETMPPQEASPLRTRGVMLLAKAMEAASGSSLNQEMMMVPRLSLSLAQLSRQMEPREAAPLARQNGLRLARNLKNTRMLDSETAVLHLILISILISDMEPADAREVANEAAGGIAREAEAIPVADEEHAVIYGLALASLTARLPADQGQFMAQAAVKQITQWMDSTQGSPAARQTALEEILKEINPVIGPKTIRMWISDWIVSLEKLPGIDPTRREELRKILQDLRLSLSP